MDDSSVDNATDYEPSSFEIFRERKTITQKHSQQKYV